MIFLITMRQIRGKNGKKTILKVKWLFYEDRKEFRYAATPTNYSSSDFCDKESL